MFAGEVACRQAYPYMSRTPMHFFSPVFTLCARLYNTLIVSTLIVSTLIVGITAPSPPCQNNIVHPNSNATHSCKPR